jgi:predicted ArsR family transcriptional regulator
MNDAELPADVLRFIEQHIDTVPHMEALLLLWKTAPQTWTDTALAARIYVDVATARRILVDLERRQLVVLSTAENGGYCYEPEAQKDSLMTNVAQTYGRKLVAVARIIHSKGSPAMREFARAFQLKGDK